MEKTIKGTGAKIGTIFSNVDRNMIEMVNVIVRLVYPDYRVVDYADPANPPSLLQENDCYLVGADGTVWGMTVQKD